MSIFKSNKVLITCGRGLAPYLRDEVTALGYDVVSQHNTGVEITATLADTRILNLSLRTASHVMFLIACFSCRNTDRLYSEVKALPWEEVIVPTEYLSVVTVADTSYVNNSMYVSQKVKDAIVDRLLLKCGDRPSSGSKRDNVVVNVFWKDDKCWVYLDTSGNKLSNRGYRKIAHIAPLRETLAAGLLMAAQYSGSVPLINPMCGSGTIAIEAALIALNYAPGLLRDNYGLTHLKFFDKTKWFALRSELRGKAKTELRAPIIGTDIDKQAIDIAKKNAIRAGVDKLIDFRVCDFEQTLIPSENSIIILNPEYGVRMGADKELGLLYRRIGDFFKQKCAGSTGYVFTGNIKVAKQIRLKPNRKLVFFNAKIECRLLEYSLYSGSKESS